MRTVSRCPADTSGPRSVSSDSGWPTRSASVFVASASTNAPHAGRSTKIRLRAQQS